MPPHSTYVEPFFGSGQVFWRKRRAVSSIIIDKCADLIAKAGAEAGVSAITGDALELLPALASALAADTLIYCDPPYLLSTRQGRFYYDHELSDGHHVMLLALLRSLKCNVLLSSYPSALYQDNLPGWRCISYKTRTRGKTLTECLWANFPEPAELHDWRYAGQTFRQRLGFKRLAARWLARLEGMSARKRGYLLDAISQRYGQRCCSMMAAPPGAVEDLNWRKATEVRVKVFEHKESGEPVYIAKAFLGTLPIYTSQPAPLPLHVMYECQDWAQRQGKTLRFEQDFV